ncbi:transcriptional regulator GcvA [Agrilutibacter solisilvae]|uniref:Transcriptional regulator GcvA n=1 Tax=Agrilutibacter solisilvae TaxID=2763317 RepID=A0A975ARH4_9GAMM|nr:transcriptional regulator GcvA [Lysobacter solisilvae]QSX76960.1 transcriptional regulator GcvA [Lysobacter solisilvae]
MPSPRPPRQAPVHLNALRAFEAAARHLSFAAAAEELHVTPSAISQQVRTLEDYLGLKLFARAASGISLTPHALRAYPEVKQGLAHLAAGLGLMQEGWRDDVVTMTLPISFAAKWLMPRIERFGQANPGLELRLDTSNRLSDYVGEGIDIGVRYGLGDYPGLEAQRLMEEDVFPVCSPAWLPPGSAGLDEARVATLPLIHDTTIDFDPAFPDWRAWLAAHGMGHVDATRGPRFNSTLLALQAAIDGQGVALGRSVAVAGDLAAGRLVRTPAGSLATRCAYYVITPPGALEQPKVRAVHDWLFAQAARDKQI